MSLHVQNTNPDVKFSLKGSAYYIYTAVGDTFHVGDEFTSNIIFRIISCGGEERVRFVLFCVFSLIG